MVPNWNEPTGARTPLIEAKLEAFQRIEEEFHRSFEFVQQVHGERRFERFPVADTVRYLHALWVCDAKDHLLSVPKTIRRYEGRLCLDLLLGWQTGDTAPVVDFLQRKLDMLPLVDVTIQVQRAAADDDERLLRRLMHGRGNMLNRQSNLVTALDAIFRPVPRELTDEVARACREYGHTPDEIAEQIAQTQEPVYAFVPHPDLARRNMIAMNALGVALTDNPASRPGDRTMRVEVPTIPAAPYAQVTISGAMTLCSPGWNNPRHLDFANAVEAVDAPDTLGRDPIVPPDATIPEPQMGPPFAP
ncbi:MAG TPA: hypothetical protein VJQ45_03100 [Ktedonobacterales bacterium]|nr:hypothetical protein [Ktedonobacterales bacterium]